MTGFGFHCARGPRETFEDAACAFVLEPLLPAAGRATVLGVFDGVCGQAHGEVASGLSSQHVAERLAAFLATAELGAPGAGPSSAMVLEAIGAALCSTNDFLLAKIAEDRALAGMATTAVVAVLFNNRLHVGWAGDSRCYLDHDGVLEQVTVDHSEVQALVEAGILTPAEARFHPLAHVITECLGKPSGFACSTAVRPLSAGDVVVLCTDGLTDVLDAGDIAAHVAACRRGVCTLADLPVSLVAHALEAGTGDNTTVLCSQYQTTTPVPVLRDRTMTGEYPVALAQAGRHIKEHFDANECVSSL